MDSLAPGLNKKSQSIYIYNKILLKFFHFNFTSSFTLHIPIAISGEAQLRYFGKFLATHDRLLRSLNADDDRQNFYHNIGKPDPLKCGRIGLEVNRLEKLDLFQLASTTNTILNKIVSVFAQLCAEVRELRRQNEELQLRFLFVDSRLRGENDEDLAPNTLIVRISELLKFFCDIQYLVQRCVVVGSEILRQLAAFFGGELICYYIIILYLFPDRQPDQQSNVTTKCRPTSIGVRSSQRSSRYSGHFRLLHSAIQHPRALARLLQNHRFAIGQYRLSNWQHISSGQDHRPTNGSGRTIYSIRW